MPKFSWEEKYKRTWESPLANAQLQAKYVHRQTYKNTKKALIRHLHIAIDKSENIDQNDFLPSFRVITKEKIDLFKIKYKNENPISTLTIYINSNNDDTLDTPGTGDFSLFTILENSYMMIKESTNIKEILVINYSITFHDSTNIEEIVNLLLKNNISISVISFCGEIKVMQNLCKRTGGLFFVPLDSDHFEVILNSFLVPKSVLNSTVSLLKIGFPIKVDDVICVCHNKFNQFAYKCVVCHSFLCDLPIECIICNTLNVSSMNLNKSIHHLQFLNDFDIYEIGECCVCNEKCKLRCNLCGFLYCKECSDFLHENINFCFNCKQ